MIYEIYHRHKRQASSLGYGRGHDFRQAEHAARPTRRLLASSRIRERGQRLLPFFLEPRLADIFDVFAGLHLGHFLLVSIIPRRLALVAIFAFILGHYFGASTWLSYGWHFGITGPIIYGVVLGFVIVMLAFPAPDKTDTKNLLSTEPDA